MLKTIDSLGPFNKYFRSISCACNMVRETREWTCGMVIVSITDGKLEHAWRRVFTVGDQSEWGACLCWRTSYPPGFYPAFLIPGHGDHSHCLLPTPFAALAETPLRFHVSSDESHWILQPFFFQICCFLGLEGEEVCGGFSLDVKCTAMLEDVSVKITNRKAKFCQKNKNEWIKPVMNKTSEFGRKKKDLRELC